MRLLLVTLVLSASIASAECAMPRPFFLPAPTVVVPANPTLYFFGPEYSLQPQLELRALDADTKAALPLQVTKLTTTEGFLAWKVKVTTPAKTRFLIKGVPGVEQTGVWTTGEFPNPGDLVLKRGTDINNAWTCSYNGLRVLDSSIDAPAYRVDYAADEATLTSGKFQSLIIDGHNGAFGSDKSPRQVQLGHRSCAGFNFRWNKSPRLAVRITALLADGSERASPSVFVLDAPENKFNQ